LILRVEFGLEILHMIDVFLQLFFRFVGGFPVLGVSGIEIFQAKMLAAIDAVGSCQFGSFHSLILDADCRVFAAKLKHRGH
jgi:hypothetical protein